jgi:hypothetical protein
VATITAGIAVERWPSQSITPSRRPISVKTRLTPPPIGKKSRPPDEKAMKPGIAHGRSTSDRNNPRPRNDSFRRSAKASPITSFATSETTT